MLPAVVPLLALLLTGTGAPVRAAKAEPPKLEQGQKLFAQGDFDGALKALDAAALEGGDAATLEKVHLLRAQCFAARQDFGRAEDAFALALEANPDTALDPARVDPTVVKLLESVRARLTGQVTMNSSPPGATLTLDGKALGAAPQTVNVPVGKHKLEARWGEGPWQAMELQVRPRRDTRIEWVQTLGPPAPGGGTEWPVERPLRPFGDLRGMLEPATTSTVSGGLELGGGVEFSYFRAGLWARLFPLFTLTPRFQFALPIFERFAVLLEVALPVTILSRSVGLGIGGGGGVEFYPVKWFGAYALVGGRHHVIWLERLDNTAFTATAGIRLRMP